MEDIGPVDYLIVAFPENRFTGAIASAVAELVDQGVVRLIDAAFVTKDADGGTAALEITELAPEVQDALTRLGAAPGGLLNEDDLLATADELEPGTSGLLLVWENVWARRTAAAIRDAGGVVLDFERVPHAVVVAAREYLVAAADAEGGAS